MAEESLRLTAAEGTDEKGKEVCAMGVVAEEISAGQWYIYASIWQSNFGMFFPHNLRTHPCHTRDSPS